MNPYRLVLAMEGDAPRRTGYVFCADDDHARTAAQALLEFHADALAVEVHDDDNSLVCRVERDASLKIRLAG